MRNRVLLVVQSAGESIAEAMTGLHAEEYAVRKVADGAAAVEWLDHAEDGGTLVLLPWTRDSQKALSALRVIRRVHPAVPVIVVCDPLDPASTAAALRNGAEGVVSKRCATGGMLLALEQGKCFAGASIAEGRREFVSSNPRMQAIWAGVKQMAASDVPVLILGESGVGKEVVAHEIHAQSPRAAAPFVKINCAALPFELLESELFGYEKGAFTGAVKSKPGRLEIADGGMVLLDEIGDMDLRLQVKLLHFLQDGEFQRLGSRDTRRVNVRVLAATNSALEQEVAEKRFRGDLYYRLNVISIHVPPLRERKDEIIPLAEHFLRKHASPGQTLPRLSSRLQEALLRCRWEGNIRELENVIRKLLVFGDPDALAESLLAEKRPSAPPETAQRAAAESSDHAPVFRAVEHARNLDETTAILAALEATHWNRRKAAKRLLVDYRRLLYRMKKLGIGAPGRMLVAPVN